MCSNTSLHSSNILGHLFSWSNAHEWPNRFRVKFKDENFIQNEKHTKQRPVGLGYLYDDKTTTTRLRCPTPANSLPAVGERVVTGSCKGKSSHSLSLNDTSKTVSLFKVSRKVIFLGLGFLSYS